MSASNLASAVPRAPTRAKKSAFSLVLLVVLWAAVEAVCLGGLFFLRRFKGLEYEPAVVRTLTQKHRWILATYLAGESSYIGISPTLGWTIRPNGGKGRYRSNSQGLRGDRAYSPVPRPGVVRISAFGDSFTHSSDVQLDATWQACLERMEPGLEVMNFGVPGYGTDQAYLRYLQDGARYRPHIAMLGFMTENINRVVNTFRPFYFYGSGIPLAKPRFVVQGGRLLLLENPIRDLEGYRRLLDAPAAELPRLGRYDWYYRTRHRPRSFDALPSVRFTHVVGDQLREPMIRDGVFNTSSEAFQVTAAIFDAFHRDALARGSLPLFVFFPERRDLDWSRKGRPRVYGPLLDHCRRRGYRTIDLQDGFERYGKDLRPRQLIANHYTRRGYAMAAQWILESLRRDHLLDVGGVRAAFAREAASGAGG